MTQRHENGVESSPGVAILADRYEVESEVGRGGMGTVYRARQVGLERTVALKILRPSTHADDAEAFEKRFQREAETLAKFDHPNIVRIYDFGSTRSGQPFLAMEFVEGPRLSDLVRNGPMSAAELLPLMVQVCKGLRYAHQRGAVHRDLKPGNLLIKEDDEGRRQLKIVDFGVVKLVDDEQTLTGEGLILGSPHCMAPEQVRGDEVDHRVDIYAFGVLLFRCLTGVYPFQRNNVAATMMGHLNDAVPSIKSVAPEIVVPDGVEEIIARCMEKDPADRFATVDEILDELAILLNVPSSALRSTGGVTHPSMHSRRSHQSSRGQVIRRPSARRSLALVALGATLGVALVAAALVSGDWQDDGTPVPEISADRPGSIDGEAGPGFTATSGSTKAGK
ncbi:MAG: serine/threonine-protein kinase, partial [Myxococcota bacterium]